MKLCLIGGGGTRAPLFVRALARREGSRSVSELRLFDADPDRLRVMGGLARACAKRDAAPFQVSLASTLDAAVDGSAFVITSIRAGGDAARARDERIALEHGVLGQETVGAAGFSLAMHNAPALIAIAAAVAKHAKEAWVLHFTNPAGLIAQILHDAGHVHQIGICDTPADLVRRTAAYSGHDERTLTAKVAGLNHLSWLTNLTDPQGTDLLPGLLADARFVATVGAPFEAELVQGLGVLPSEYLHYYYHRDQALRHQQKAQQTRGALLDQLNRELLEGLAKLDPDGEFDATLDDAVALYERYTRARDVSYRDAIGRPPEDTAPQHDAPEGYAGIALDLIEAIDGDTGRAIVASVPNGWALPGLDREDVVEVTARVGRGGPVPEPVRPLPDDVISLVEAVKGYERLASRAIRNRDAKLAARALCAHPLIGSYPVAKRLVGGFLAAHAGIAAGWR